MKVLCILLCVAFTSGVYIDNNGIHEDKIIGGDTVRIEDVPHQASLVWLRLEYFCGATIIHHSCVITASHCVQNRTHIAVRTGSGLKKTLGKRHRIERIIMHEDYQSHSKNNDIALIKLIEPIQFNNKQQPIEIAKPYNMPREGELMQISGFGETGIDLGESDLKATYVHVVNQEHCRRVYWEDPITDNMFCAGNGYPAFDDGDSGGPGVIHGKLYGVISSISNWESRIFPGVYTKMYKYYSWIVEKTRVRF